MNTTKKPIGRPRLAGSHKIVKATVRGAQLARIEEAAGDIPLGQYLLLCEEELACLRKQVMQGFGASK